MQGKNTVLVLAVLAAFTAGVSTSRADPITVTYDGDGLGEDFTMHAPGHLGDNMDVNCGQLLITYDGMDKVAYCVDIDHYSATMQADIASPSSLNNGNYPNNGNLVAYLFDTYASNVTTNEQAAALQAAIWEVLFETTGTLDVTSGTFYLTGGDTNALTLANSYLASMPADYTPNPSDVVLASTDGYQNMIVPEPGSLIVLAIGGLLVFWRRRSHGLAGM